jgi:hypothetical protein
MSDYTDAMETAATDTRCGDLVRDLLIRSAKMAGLAAGILCLATACSTAATTPPAATPSATPGPGGTQATTPPASAPADSPSSPGSSSGPVTSQPASGAEVAQFTAASQGQCGFESSSDTLTGAKVTSNGWGIATITADNPQDQGNAQMVFRLQGTSWVYNTCGSDFSGSDVPANVIQALG